MKEFALRTLWLGEQAFDGVIWLWYLSLPIFLLGALAIAWLVRSKQPLSRAVKTQVLLMFVACLGILLMASAWYWPAEAGYHPEQTELPLSILNGFSVVLFVSCLACAALARGQRIPAFALALPGIWLGYWCLFVATMSISGIWL